MAALIEWRDEFTLGIEAIDREHRRLADGLNRLARLVPLTGHAALAEATELLQVLHQHTLDHFAHEERLMEAIGYDGLGLHRHEHVMLLAELKSFTTHVEAGSESLDLLALRSLKEWLLAHVTGSDKLLADALCRENGDG